MNKATKVKLAATNAAQQHERITGQYSYAYHCGVLESSIDMLCAELEQYTPEKTGKKEHETTYAHDGGELVVHFDCEEGEPMTRDDPGCDPSVIVNAVFANGMNITCLLEGTDEMERIEAHCYEVAERAFIDSEEDAAISRWESRRDDSLMGAA